MVVFLDVSPENDRASCTQYEKPLQAGKISFNSKHNGGGGGLPTMPKVPDPPRETAPNMPVKFFFKNGDIKVHPCMRAC